MFSLQKLNLSDLISLLKVNSLSCALNQINQLAIKFFIQSWILVKARRYID